MKSNVMHRRQFLKSAAIGAGITILPSGFLSGQNAPSNKLNIALIGAYGRGSQHWDALKSENIVALCDVDENALAKAAEVFPGAKHYVDWRKCLEDKDIDAVVCCTTDHTHAFVANWAMNRDLHVYCEKPLANSVEEARVVRETYLKKRNKIATQVGTQRHSDTNFARVRELIHDGAIGTLKDARAWGDRQLPKPGYLPAEGTPPKTLHYDLWIGPSPWHPYNPGYFGARPGANCLNWNMYWDFGTGQVGDMGSHTMDLVWNVIDGTRPTSAEGVGDPVNPDVSPVKLTSTWQMPANNWRPEIKVQWFQGGAMPPSPKGYIDLNKIGHGAMFTGDKGILICDFNSRIILPWGKDADMTYYKPRAKEDVDPGMGHFQKQWFNACKTDLKTPCNFDYAGQMIEMMLLGLVAYRVGKKIDYNGDKGTTSNPEAQALIKRQYREGWTLNG